MNRCQCGRLISHHKHMCLACMWQEAQKRAQSMKIKPKEICTCSICGKEFFKRAYTRGIYCSDECRKEGYERYRNSLVTTTCIVCGQKFWRKVNSHPERCPECRENHRTILSVQKEGLKKKRKAKERVPAAEKHKQLERLPDGPDRRDFWMGDRGMMPVSEKEAGRPGARAVIRINPAKLRAPLLPPTREKNAESPEDAFYRKVAEAKKRQQQYDKKKPRNSHPHDGYTKDEDALILDMDDAGAPAEEIAEVLGRSKAGVLYRLARLRRDQDDLRKLLAKAPVL